MIGHLGSKVSALLDGRLSEAEEERAWEHVHACHFCRDLVEREGWVKTQLASLRPSSCAVSAGFKSSLLAAAACGPEPTPAPSGFLYRHRSVMVLGSSAAGVAIVGMAALSGVFTSSSPVDRRPTMTTIDQPISRSTATPAARTTPQPVVSSAASASAPASTSVPSGAPTSTSATTPAAVRSARPVAVTSRREP